MLKLCPNCNTEFESKGKWVELKFCSKPCANKRTHSEETKQKISNKLRKHPVKVKTVSGSAEHREKMRLLTQGRKLSDDHKRKISEAAKRNGFGGHTSKKALYYNNNGVDVYLQSSYEVKLAKLLDEHSLIWERPQPLLWVDSEGKEHRYYPDFKVGEIYIDTKNDYLAQKDAVKIQFVREQNKIDLRVLTLNMINAEYIGSLV